MLVPLSWLREFVPYEGTAQTLGEKLTMLGLELENIINPFAAISGVVTGYVAECIQHPDSDHLHCCKVDIGTNEILDIVCGAPNVAQGQKVAVAPVGCHLPDGTVIKKAKLRGQPSRGMICSERELGLSEDHKGILVLPEATVIGEPLSAALRLDTEVLDLSITPNRADCLSILGVARETAMAFNLPFNVPELPLLTDAQCNLTVPVEIANPVLCPMYSGRVIMDITLAPSPMRMRYRLLAVGIRPISNVVDVTNYILMETGQPLHSFDLDKLEGRRIFIKNARQGEKFTTLDGRERTLDTGDICIWDAGKIIGLAGVMGGLNTEIGPESKNVFLESAVFQPQSIRRTSRRLGLVSEASYRFERGIDQRRTIWALDRACALLASVAGGRVSSGFSCVEPRPFLPANISYRPQKASGLLGVDISDAFQAETLEKLGCSIEKRSSECWTVEQPSWRPDLTRAADLIEEVGRVYGLDTIEPVLPPVRRKLDENLAPHGKYHFWQKIRHWGAGLGLNEAINYSFTGQKDLDALNMDQTGRVAVLNPLSEDQDVLRTCLAPGLLRDLSNNLAFGEQSVRLFELATTFFADKNMESGVHENGTLAILLYGLRHEAVWPYKEEDFDYGDIKGIVENLFKMLHLEDCKYSEFTTHPYLAPCASLEIGGNRLGFIGMIKPEIARGYHAQKEIWECELSLDMLEQMKQNSSFRPLPVYPPVRRDITVAAIRGIKAQEVLDNILMLKIPLLEGAVLIDCYEPEDTDERNLTFRLTFRNPARTLKDTEVDKEREKIAAALSQKAGLRV